MPATGDSARAHHQLAVDQRPVRKEFRRAPRLLGKMLVSSALMPLLVTAAGMVIHLHLLTSLILVFAMAMILVPGAVIAAHTLPQLLRNRRLVVGPAGVQLHGQRGTITIPWRDIASWSVEVPPGRINRLVGRVAVLATPAPHVQCPQAGDRGALWTPAAGAWRIIDPQLTDRTVEEVAAAFERYAAVKRVCTFPRLARR